MESATDGLLQGPGAPPLPALLSPLHAWHERRHLELMADRGFDDVRRAHNAVFVNLPADGIRLTGLAEEAGLSKQAMGELVDDLESKGYVERVPDPSDGRAKLIVWADRGLRAHNATLEAFAAIEVELRAAAGDDAIADLRRSLVAVRRGLDSP